MTDFRIANNVSFLVEQYQQLKFMSQHDSETTEKSDEKEKIFFKITEPIFVSSFNILSDHANKMAHEKGFYDDEKPLESAIALQHSELSEVLEALRDGNPESTKIEGFSQLEEEYADLIIRILDTCAEHDLNVGEAVIEKMKYNSDREYKHGKEF